MGECVKRGNAFVRKSPGNTSLVLSAEPGNLCGLHSSRFSGLANKKVLGISSTKSGQKESIVLTTRHKKDSLARRPKSMLLKAGVKKNTKKGLAQVEKSVGANFYRRDLVELAKVKYEKVKASFKKKKVEVKSRRARS